MSLSTQREEDRVTAAMATLDEDALAFLRELPDFDQEVSAQALCKLDGFTAFPKLPTEMRLKIWRLTFPPGRKIRLRPRQYCNSQDHANDCDCIPKHVPAPVALYVNSESRQEALKTYRILFPDPMIAPSVNGIPQPIVISPTKDTPYIMLHDTDPLDDAQRYFYHLVQSSPNGLEGFKSLEIRGWHTIIPADDEEVMRHIQAVNFSCCFVDLEEVRVYLDDCYYGDQTSLRVRRHGINQLDWTDDHQLYCETTLNIIFSWAEENIRGYKRPKSSILYWNRDT